MALELAGVLKADYILIGELEKKKHESIQTLAIVVDGKLTANARYDLAGKPCEHVIGKSVCIYLSNVADQFPKDTLLKEMGVSGYIGVPLLSTSGDVLGIMVAMYRSSLSNTDFEDSILQIFAAKVGSEIDRQLAEEELRQYEHIVSTSTDMLALLDKNFVYIAANKAYLKAFGLTAEGLIGKSITDVFGKEFFETVIQPPAQRCLAGEQVNYQEWFDFSGEDRTYMDIKYFPYLDRDRNVQGFVVTARDITDRKQAENELRQHQENLAHMARVNTMGEMATGLAHELNQPLAAISAYCFAGEQSLAGTKTPTPNHLLELFEKMTGQAMRAGEIIRRLRALVGKRTAVRTRVDIVEPIKEVLHLLDADLNQNNVRVEQQIDHSNCVAMIDDIQIQQVLVNLIRNAMDAMSETPRDQRIIKITSTLTEENLIEIAVCDTGKGIDMEMKDQIFDAFFSTQSQGMGMGLAISRTIVESHGGKLWLTPNSDRGVIFHFTVPVAQQGRDDDSE